MQESKKSIDGLENRNHDEVDDNDVIKENNEYKFK